VSDYERAFKKLQEAARSPLESRTAQLTAPECKAILQRMEWLREEREKLMERRPYGAGD